MISWKNLDTLAAYKKLCGMKNRVNLPQAMAGEGGAERVAKYSVPMACGLNYNYAAKAVDDGVLEALAALADEAQLIDKYDALYNGEVINTGEKRLVLHQLTRGQLGGDVVADGVNIVFTTSPVFLNAAIKASVQHPGMKVLNCSLLASFHHVRSYYLRVHEAKFIIGAIAGAMADNNRIGYIADYPIYGTPASINAFALGARLVNPRAQIFLDWSTRRDHDVFETFRRNDINIICNRDISAPAQASREFGLYRVEKDGMPLNLAMPVWNWGSLYETILRSLLSGSWNNDSASADGLAMAYWPGISTGAVDVFYSQRLPYGTQQLVESLKTLFQSGSFNPFSGKILSQDGMVHSESDESISPAHVIAMNWLCDNVIGAIPDISQLKPEAHPLVRLQGLNDAARPDPRAFAWTGTDNG